MKAPELYALIDVGSNQLVMTIAEIYSHAKPRIVEQLRGSLALGEDTYTTRRIKEDNIVRCCAILTDFKQKLKEYKIKEVCVVATSAIREALNRDYVVNRIRQSTGFDVEILDNSMERYYHQLAMTERMEQFSELIAEGVTVIDIGAGSIQVSKYSEKGLLFSHNLLLGALRVHEMLDRLKDKTRDYTNLLDEYISSELNDFRILEGDFEAPGYIIALGAQMPYFKSLMGMKHGDITMSLSSFEDLLKLLRSEQPIELTTRYGVPAHEAELLLPAATILEKYSLHAKGHVIYMPPGDLGESLILERSLKHKKVKHNYGLEKDILTSVRHIADRFQYDAIHTELVTGHALKIFDALKKTYALTNRERLYLEIASILHDVGKFIQINRHSHQSFHVINSLDLFGISNQERLMIAFIARFHSASWFPTPDDCPGLNTEERQTVLRLASILRLADSLDASHTQKLSKIQITIKEPRLFIEVDNSLETTLEQSTMSKKGQLLRDVYGLIPEFRYRPTEYFLKEASL